MQQGTGLCSGTGPVSQTWALRGGGDQDPGLQAAERLGSGHQAVP